MIPVEGTWRASTPLTCGSRSRISSGPIRRHHQLSAVAKGHVVFLAKFVSEPVALDAQPRLERILRIVDAGVVHAAVARAGGHAELRKLLDQEHVLPPRRDRARDGAANN